MVAKEKPLYISVDEQDYKKSKAGMLNSQIELLNSMKHLHSIKDIKNEKFKIKLRLYSLFSSLSEDFERLDAKLPAVDIPRTAQERTHREPIIKKTPDPGRADIESELQNIREKLKKLNAG
jgi:hypothetical protein